MIVRRNSEQRIAVNPIAVAFVAATKVGKMAEDPEGEQYFEIGQHTGNDEYLEHPIKSDDPVGNSGLNGAGSIQPSSSDKLWEAYREANGKLFTLRATVTKLTNLLTYLETKYKELYEKKLVFEERLKRAEYNAKWFPADEWLNQRQIMAKNREAEISGIINNLRDRFQQSISHLQRIQELIPETEKIVNKMYGKLTFLQRIRGQIYDWTRILNEPLPLDVFSDSYTPRLPPDVFDPTFNESPLSKAFATTAQMLDSVFGSLTSLRFLQWIFGACQSEIDLRIPYNHTSRYESGIPCSTCSRSLNPEAYSEYIYRQRGEMW